MTNEESRVYLSFRFHVNFYHSYRGDSLDEKGIGKDLRIIRSLLDDLDALEAEGIQVRCAWDIENYFSLETYLPRHAPDILDRIRSRVERGFDEVELMSWNNGIVTAHTREEFRAAIGWAIHNPAGSGVADLFPSWAPIVRPQECMFTAAHIPEYRALGVEALSIYYSAIPFNGFGSFIPALPSERRYNPMKIIDPVSGEGMRLLPACNHADIVEHWVSLRRWLVSMRRDQVRFVEARDLILVIDMDADDTFWTGYLPTSIRGLVPSACGFRSLVRSVSDLSWLRFTRPWEYMLCHEDLGAIELGQDLADGAWDGYSSWAEKYENAALWTLVARARRVDELAARLESIPSAPGASPTEALSGISGSEEAGAALSGRLLAMSTTHFGMASPVMNSGRLQDGFHRAQAALEAAGRRLENARSTVGEKLGAWYFDEGLDSLPLGAGAIVTLRGAFDESGLPSTIFTQSLLPDRAGLVSNRVLSGIRCFEQDAAGVDEVRAVVNPPSSRVDRFTADMTATRHDTGIASGSSILKTSIMGMSDGRIELRAFPGRGVIMAVAGKDIFTSPMSLPWIEYGRRTALSRPTAEPRVTTLIPDEVAELRLRGEIPMPGGQAAIWTHVYTMAAGLSGVVVDVSVSYPKTAHRGFDRGKAARLDRDWDPRWRTVAPFELSPALDAEEDAPVRVWKRGFFGLVSSYGLGYHRFGPNREQDSLDNHVTNGWVAVSGGGRGLLIAQSASATTNYAFCPMRTRLRDGKHIVVLNPFGTYAGRQWKYPLAVTGLGRLAALLAADNLDSYGPSWEGSAIRFSLMLAPFEGSEPPLALQRDALLFATPPEWV